VNVWPSQEGSEAAAGDPRRLGALERVAGAITGQQKEHYVLEHCLVPSAAP